MHSTVALAWALHKITDEWLIINTNLPSICTTSFDWSPELGRHSLASRWLTVNKWSPFKRSILGSAAASSTGEPMDDGCDEKHGTENRRVKRPPADFPKWLAIKHGAFRSKFFRRRCLLPRNWFWKYYLKQNIEKKTLEQTDSPAVLSGGILLTR